MSIVYSAIVMEGDGHIGMHPFEGQYIFALYAVCTLGV